MLQAVLHGYESGSSKEERELQVLNQGKYFDLTTQRHKCAVWDELRDLHRSSSTE